MAIGRPIGLLGKQNSIGARPNAVRVQAITACREVIRSAPNPKMRNSDAQKRKSDLGRSQQEAELERDVARRSGRS